MQRLKNPVLSEKLVFKMSIEEGKKVKIEYEGKLDDGQVFDSSKSKGPLEFTIGEGQVIPKFEDEIKAMKKGEEKEINIKAEDGYGQRNDQLKKKVPKDALPKEKKLKEGMGLMVTTPDGKKFPAKIDKIEDENVVVDLNHPLAGQNLNFKVKLLEVN